MGPKGPCLGCCHSHCPLHHHSHLANRWVALDDRPLKPKPLVRPFPPLIPLPLSLFPHPFLLVFIPISSLFLSGLPYLNHKPSPHPCLNVLETVTRQKCIILTPRLLRGLLNSGRVLLNSEWSESKTHRCGTSKGHLVGRSVAVLWDRRKKKHGKEIDQNVKM